MIKPASVRLVHGNAVSHDWPLRQLDVNIAFLGTFVYMAPPTRFIDRDNPDYVCKLNKELYGLKQAPRAWYMELHNFPIAYGFVIFWMMRHCSS